MGPPAPAVRTVLVPRRESLVPKGRSRARDIEGSVRIPPSEIAILLVGPRVSHLVPHFSSRGYEVEACGDGSAAISALDARVRDLLVLELNLGDLSVTELLLAAQQVQPHLGFLLLDDASRAGQIVKAMVAGVHGYLATPPDEERLFREVEQQVIAARARAGTLLRSARDEVEKLQKEALEAGMKGDFLEQELAALKRELEALRESADAERVSLTEQLEAAQRRVEEAAGLNVQHAMVVDEADDLKKKLAKLEEELASTRASGDDRERAVEDAQRRADDVRRELDEARAEAERLRGEVDEARHERDAFEERALDIELQMEELRTKISFLEGELDSARARAEEAEAFFKKERLRLIEEKQDAAAGSQEAFQKMEKLVAELQAARSAQKDAEERLRALEAKAPG